MDAIGTRNLYDLLTERTDLHADTDFVVFEAADGQTETLTYGDFHDRVQHCAAGLAGAGIAPGDAVLLHLGASIDFLTVWFALARLGAVSVPTNLASPAPELVHAIEVSGARHAVTEPAYLDVVRRAREQAPAGGGVLVVARTGEPEDGAVLLTDLKSSDLAPLRAIGLPAPADVAEVLFTSGTTSRPKGAELTHANLLRAGQRVALHYALDETDRPLVVLPLFHVGGQAMGLLCALHVGGTAILVERYSASAFWRQVRDHGATFVMVVPTHVRTLLAQPPDPSDGQHTLRRMGFGMRVTEPERDDFEKRFAVDLRYCYGQTEAILLIAIAPLFGPRNWPAVGLPAFDRVIRIADSEDRDVPLGEVGQILVQADPGRTVMRGYANDPEATARTLAGGWLHTGDLGRFDEQGYLHFVDREKDMIKRAGENISALEVETVLLGHAAVEEAAVIAVPDAIRDEAVKAFVVLADGASATVDELLAHCAEQLARFKVPSYIDMVDSLPKTSIGKVQKKLLPRDV